MLSPWNNNVQRAGDAAQRISYVLLQWLHNATTPSWQSARNSSPPHLQRGLALKLFCPCGISLRSGGMVMARRRRSGLTQCGHENHNRHRPNDNTQRGLDQSTLLSWHATLATGHHTSSSRHEKIFPPRPLCPLTFCSTS